jgi:hypothetical protein
MDQDSHIASDQTPMSLGRITFVVLSLFCAGGGIFAGMFGVWQGFLFAAFWIPMFFIGATGLPRVLFEPVVVEGAPEATGFHSYARSDYLLLAAMAVVGGAYILLAYLWPGLPHFAPGQALLYLFFATACNAYIWQSNITVHRQLAGCVHALLLGVILLSVRRPDSELLAGYLIYAGAWGMIYCGLAMRRTKVLA